ncbi:Transposon Ty3-I Gag-Pol polyprotein [Araneus ventricosus]|uniref:Transposon Ty3-I Gag-Pol polyprotein n=1 Tax=Araneus ventricosus TaxID=182803 RepID=A0A4Y2CGM8_ARAVE|nr:Transposon Ty3-I Gag-Pol polyprotein [Araneus ventricosus]
MGRPVAEAWRRGYQLMRCPRRLIVVQNYEDCPKKALLLLQSQKGLIGECECPYATPVVLVPNPTGTIRLCVDYRKLNANTIADAYPLPRMHDLLQEAKHSAYVSAIDLKSGCHHANVQPPHRDKTAFVCPFGTFRFIRMPFGLRNAPVTFQRFRQYPQRIT